MQFLSTNFRQYQHGELGQRTIVASVRQDASGCSDVRDTKNNERMHA